MKKYLSYLQAYIKALLRVLRVSAATLNNAAVKFRLALNRVKMLGGPGRQAGQSARSRMSEALARIRRWFASARKLWEDANRLLTHAQQLWRHAKGAWENAKKTWEDGKTFWRRVREFLEHAEGWRANPVVRLVISFIILIFGGGGLSARTNIVFRIIRLPVTLTIGFLLGWFFGSR